MENSDDTVNISKSRYKDLLKAYAFLSALEAAGVNNWDGYDFAMEIYEEDNNDY